MPVPFSLMREADVIVVGAGAAGIFAAWRAATLGARTILLEKTKRIGTKILVSGGGKCNITHSGPIEDVLKAFRPNEAKFLRPSFYRFTNEEMVEMLVDRGLEVYTRPDGRIFPVHQTAKDVVSILREFLADARVDIRFDAPATGLRPLEDGRIEVLVGEEQFVAKSVVVSVGGSSFPNSGTTGDGWPWMRALGHQIVPIRAALAPMYLQLTWEPPAGVAVRDGILRARGSSGVLTKWRGDLLFSHQGVTGPSALAVSRIVAEHMVDGPVTLEIDIIPDIPQEALNERWIEDAKSSPHRLVLTQLESLVAARIATLICESADVEPASKLKDLDRKSRNRLVARIKSWPLGPVRAAPLEKGEVVAGGVSLDQVNPKTMESTLVPGLFLCGEILDIAGPVGGYNLQAAWSTGFVSGDSAAIHAGFK